MEYLLRPTQFFMEQLDQLSDKAARIVGEKLKLLKINPYRYKRIRGYNLFLFRIRFEDEHKEKRLIYLVDKPHVNLLCILDRDNGCKDLRKYLKLIRWPVHS